MGTKRPLRTLTLASLCTIFLVWPGVIFGRTLYVDSAASGRQDGASWTGAFKYLQDALAVAVAGDEIRVAQGVYRPDQGLWITPGGRGATFRLIGGVPILGGFAGAAGANPDLREVSEFVTTLSGDLAGNDDPNDGATFFDNSSHVVTATEASNGAVLDGLTIAHGHDYDSGGNGLFNQGASLTLRDCTFLSNWTGRRNGGGILNNGGHLRLENCRFVRNYGDEGAGALCNWGGSAQVINCDFIENSARDGAGAIENVDGNADFFHCLFQGNHADEGAGGIKSVTTLRLLYCTFIDNHAHEHEGALFIGGSAVVAHCLFCRNRAEDWGAIYVGSASPVRLDQCTFYANVSTDDGVGAVYCPSSWSTLPAGSFQARGCIFWANGAWREQDEGGDKLMTGYREQIGGDRNAATLEYCCIQGWTPDRGGTGNIGADPLFVAPDQNDFHLKSQAGHWDAAFQAWVFDDVTSPCIDAGDPNAPGEYEPFPNGGRLNMGVYGGTSEASKSWFGTEPNATINAADLNGDGRVDYEDYRLAFQRWPQTDQ